MKTQFTPGPWKVVDSKYKPRDQYERFAIECYSNIPGVPGIIAKCGYRFNANLIAAAPDLLEALKELQKRIHAHVKMNVKKHYSLLVADAAASKAIHNFERA